MTRSYDPFDSMERMFEQLRRSAAPFEGRDSNIRLETTDEGYVAMADLPGFEREDITVRFEDGLLTVTAESEATAESETITSTRRRRVHDELHVPAPVVEDDITATYRNGVLEVTLPTETDVADDEHVIDVE